MVANGNGRSKKPQHLEPMWDLNVTDLYDAIFDYLGISDDGREEIRVAWKYGCHSGTVFVVGAIVCRPSEDGPSIQDLASEDDNVGM